MRAGFYPKLAMDGIRKNKRLYIPYILTGSIMVMMFYILCFLVESPTLAQMPGGDNLKMILPMGTGVIGFFSLLFLFYTNSFLIRQRNREFGLYNILGMDKRNISRIMVWESLFVGVSSILFGLILGIALSKLAELGLLNLLRLDVSYQLGIGTISVRDTACVYGVIYLLLLVSSLIKVHRTKPLALLQSSRVGEKPPKGNWVLAFAGAVGLGTAYFLAVSIEEPMTALTVFFGAVLLVIVATYLLFIAGSVVLCRILQKNKGYYYKPNHFVSVSSMVYRMKRNGAGLASICILLTMVLVMISSSASLYFGSEDTLRNRYPNSINVEVKLNDITALREDNVSSLRDIVNENGGSQGTMTDYRTATISGLFTDTGIIVDVESVTDFHLLDYDNVGMIQAIALSDYNRLMGTDAVLEDGECMLYCIRTKYEADTFAIAGEQPYRVRKVLDHFFADGHINMQIVPTICIVVSDIEAFAAPVLSRADYRGEPMLQLYWKCGIDIDKKAETQIALSKKIDSALQETKEDTRVIYSSVESREANRQDFFVTFGSLFFLGIMLSIVFLFAAVLIIYYKQISEGYEDISRFEIMQKVGMTKKDIKRSINSQMLTVFFLPLLFAGLHLAFAFPMIWKMLQLFNLRNLSLVILVTVVSFCIFGVFYALVYKITSNAYCSIVSREDK